MKMITTTFIYIPFIVFVYRKDDDMRFHNEQQKEIATIKERDIKLNLSDADVKRLFKISAEAGLTPEELLESFIGDLVDGTYSNGSDERMYAKQWYMRCGYCYDKPKTFLRFLLEYDDDYEVTYFVSLIKDRDSTINSLTFFEVPEEIYILKNEIEFYQQEIDEYFSKYVEWCVDEPTGCFDDEIRNVIDWHDRLTDEISRGGNVTFDEVPVFEPDGENIEL